MKNAGIALLLIITMASMASAQVASRGVSSDGKDFYVGWLYPSYDDQNLNLGGRDPKPFFGVYILVSSYTDNEFSVSYFDDKGKEVNSSSFQIAKRRSLIVPIDRTYMRMDGGGPNGFDGEIAQWRAMHVTSKKPINVQFFSSGANSGGSYLALPVNVLGKEYVVESYKDNPSGAGGYLSSENASGYFMVIAAFDGTTVNIVPNSTTKVAKQAGVNCGPGATGVPQGFTISLQRGQCYMVKSQGVDSYCDISGSTVVADKPIAVLGGHENAYTDGSDIGTILVEARDYMVEQMIPVEYWDSAGYFTVPMVDSKNAQGGDGDNIAMFYGKLTDAPSKYPNETTVTLNAPGAITYKVGAYPSAVAIKSGVTTPTSSYDNNGAKMHVVQYDQRMQGGAPYPAPSQMSIIPQSSWKSSYLWYIPANITPQEVYQGYYITLICDKDDYNNGTLQWAQDGGPLVPIKTAGTVNGQKNFGPNFPNLIGMSIKLNAPRAYYATSTTKTPFVVYNYGFRAIDADRDLGDFCSDDHFFANANPVGLAGKTWDTSSFKITVDTLCSMWNICASVSGPNSPEIRSVIILNDPANDIANSGTSTGYDSYNVRFDQSVDADGNGEADFAPGKSTQCIKVFVENPFDAAYASVLIQDDHGNYAIVPLQYRHDKISLSSSPAYLHGPNTIMTPMVTIGDKQLIDLTYKNYGAKGDSDYVIQGISLTQGKQGFTVLSTTPSLPTALHPGDSLVVHLSFESTDTLAHPDTLQLLTQCFGAPVYLFGQNGTGLIAASDFDFGEGVLNQTQYHGTIIVRNLGNQPFVLKKNFFLTDTTNFSIEPNSIARLPYTVYPSSDLSHPSKDTMQLWLDFHPKKPLGLDTATIYWSTDIRSPFQSQIKPWSKISGVGVKLGIKWDRSIQRDTTFKDRPIVRRVNLLSAALSKASIDKVYFTGADAAEYSVSADQIKLNPLENFSLDPGDTIWVQYTFTPNLTKPELQKYLDRHTDLVVTYFLDGSHTLRDSEVIHFIGVVDSLTSEVSKIITSSDVTLHPYINNDKVVIPIQNPDNIKDVSLYDLLGKKVMQWNAKLIERSQTGLVLPKPNISSGLYILKIEADRMTASGKVMIVKE